MALQYKQSYNNISKIGDKEIHFRPWSAKDERLYLKLIEKTENITEEDFYNTLIKPCIEEKDLVLSQAEQKKLLLDIRIKSISEFIEDDIVCEECEEITKIKVKIEDCLTYIPNTFKPIKIDDIEIEFDKPKTMKDYFNVTEGESVVDYIYDMFLLHISKIKMVSEDGEKVYDDISIQDKEDFINSLPSKMFDEFFEKFQEMLDETKITYKFTCPKCKHKQETDYNFIPNLLWV